MPSVRRLFAKAPASAAATAKRRKKRRKKRKHNGQQQAQCTVPKRKRTSTRPAPKPKHHAKKKAGKRKRVRPRAKCTPRKKKPTVPAPSSSQPPPVGVPVPPPGQATPPPPGQPSPPEKPVSSPIAMYDGPFGHEQAMRLMFRAGFGPRPGDTARLSAMGMKAAIASLTRPVGPANLVGPAPTKKDGTPWIISPVDIEGDDLHYWFDRMMRTDQPFVERMALVFHDWFATHKAGIPQLDMLNQTNLFRKYAFGSFKDLVHDITFDYAMIPWLSLNKSVVNNANENYARELMELFTLGVGRGYTEQDIREAARALTGITPIFDPVTKVFLRYEVIQTKHDQGVKTIFGQQGNFGWEDVARLVIEHPLHPSYFVRKLWSYFIPVEPSDGDVDALSKLYVGSGYTVRPVLEAVLSHPTFYTGPPMVKPPTVYVAGMLRARQKFAEGELWGLNAAYAGQELYRPPDVGGWDDSRWLDSNTMLARWQTVYQLMVSQVSNAADPDETPEEALAAALKFWDDPPLREQTRAVLLDFARTSVPATPDGTARALRQNALRHLIGISPDFQVC